MQLVPKIKKHQEGGQMTAPEETAPAQDPMEMIMQGAMQALQNQDCQTALAVCQAILEVSGQGAAPTGEVAFAKGGKIRKFI